MHSEPREGRRVPSQFGSALTLPGTFSGSQPRAIQPESERFPANVSGNGENLAWLRPVCRRQLPLGCCQPGGLDLKLPCNARTSMACAPTPFSFPQRPWNLCRADVQQSRLQLMKAKPDVGAGLCNHPLNSFYATQLEFHKLRKPSFLKHRSGLSATPHLEHGRLIRAGQEGPGAWGLRVCCGSKSSVGTTGSLGQRGRLWASWTANRDRGCE